MDYASVDALPYEESYAHHTSATAAPLQEQQLFRRISIEEMLHRWLLVAATCPAQHFALL